MEDRYDNQPARGSLRMGATQASLLSGRSGLPRLSANIGTWFQNVGGVWLMTRFTASPLLIALMQTATTLPVFLVGLPAGALADIVNRRRLLLATQSLILVTAAALSALTFTH